MAEETNVGVKECILIIIIIVVTADDGTIQARGKTKRQDDGITTEATASLCKKVNVCFYIAHVSSLLARLKRFTLHTLADLFFRHQLDLSMKHSSHAAITREDYSLTLPLPPIARTEVLM